LLLLLLLQLLLLLLLLLLQARATTSDRGRPRSRWAVHEGADARGTGSGGGLLGRQRGQVLHLEQVEQAIRLGWGHGKPATRIRYRLLGCARGMRILEHGVLEQGKELIVLF
jgi:hypothetical protein